MQRKNNYSLNQGNGSGVLIHMMVSEPHVAREDWCTHAINDELFKNSLYSVFISNRGVEVALHLARLCPL
jgi:hypothetical protein